MSYAIPQSTERMEEVNKKLADATLNLLDVCVSSKTLGDISNCDSEIPRISQSCKDKHIGGCDSRIDEYYRTRSNRIAEAHDALNSAFTNLFEVCSSTYGIECDQGLSDIKNYCENYRNTIAYVETCDDPYLSKEPTTISEQTTMSEECKEAKEIMKQNRWGANNNDPTAVAAFGMAMNDYNRLGCP